MTNLERDARKAELEKEIAETRELIQNLTSQIRPMTQQLDAIKNEETLEMADTWLESDESIHRMLDRAWSEGSGDRAAYGLISEYIKNLRTSSKINLHFAGHYDVSDHDVKVIGVYVGLDHNSTEDDIAGLAKSVREICSTIGSEADDYFCEVMWYNTGDYDEKPVRLYPNTLTVENSSWGQNETLYEGKNLEECLQYIAGNYPFDGV